MKGNSGRRRRENLEEISSDGGREARVH